MKTAVVKITSCSPVSQSKVIDVLEFPKLNKEGHDAYELRTWRERCHYDSEGNVYISGISFKNCLSEAAKYLNMQIAGKGKATYTKHFEAGVMCVDKLMLGVKKDEAKSERVYVPSDGKRGGTTRVWKYFPVFHDWSGTLEFMILDDIITQEVFQQVISEAGKFIGVGRWRPRNNGLYGRFQAEVLSFG